MTKIPTYSGGGVRADNLREVPQGVHAAADAFGAGRARDLHAFGAAAHNAGGPVMDIAEIRAKRADDALIRTLDAEAGDAWRAWEREQTVNRRGLDAKDLAADAAKWWEERRKSDLERLDGDRPRQREIIEARYGRMRDSGVAAFERYSYAEAANADRLSRAAQNESFIREAETHGLMNPALAEEQRRLRHANILHDMRGRPEAARAEALREADREFHRRMAAAHAERSLRGAIGYLEQEEVRKALGPDEWQKAKNAFGKELTLESDRRLAAALGDRSGDESEFGDALREAMPDADEDRIDKAHRYGVSRIRTRRAKSARERKALEDKAGEVMRAAGWDPDAVDPAWPEDLRDTMLDRSLRESEAGGRREDRLAKAAEKAKYLEVMDLSDDELHRKILNGEWQDIADGLGRGTEELENLEKRIAGQKIEGLTALQHARNEFSKIHGSWDAKRNENRRTRFIARLEEAGGVRAAPAEERRKIVKDLLVDL